ncbi:hypothetical protein ABZ345_18075 [Lentzea sp. NPDC005914]|uniref:hypothetical protein n=1 Tax=Lentzea sp. NPDC005914 TaxID=3154572 RepID=UPI0033C7414A
MRNHIKEEFEYRKIIESAATIADLDFERCAFGGGVIMQEADDPAYQLVVRTVSLRKCKVGNVVLYGVRFEDVTVDTLSHSKPIELEACVCSHVVLRGKLGAVRFSPAVEDDSRAVLAPAAAKLYEDVDWALDITEAEFSDIEIWDVPGHLVKRDPETQFLVHKSAAAAADVDALPEYAQILVERAAEAPYDTSVLAAPIRSKDFEEALDAFRKLRDLGIAE